VRFRYDSRPRSLAPSRALAAFISISMLKPYGGKMSRGQKRPGATYYCPTKGCPQARKSVKIVTGAPKTCAACGTSLRKRKRIV
jgi:hypothetical protein